MSEGHGAPGNGRGNSKRGLVFYRGAGARGSCNSSSMARPTSQPPYQNQVCNFPSASSAEPCHTSPPMRSHVAQPSHTTGIVLPKHSQVCGPPHPKPLLATPTFQYPPRRSTSAKPNQSHGGRADSSRDRSSQRDRQRRSSACSTPTSETSRKSTKPREKAGKAEGPLSSKQVISPDACDPRIGERNSRLTSNKSGQLTEHSSPKARIKTKVAFQIKGFFKDASTLKAIVVRLINKLGVSNATLFEETILCTKEHGLFAVNVEGNDRMSTERMIEAMAAAMKKALQTEVTYDYAHIKPEVPPKPSHKSKHQQNKTIKEAEGPGAREPVKNNESQVHGGAIPKRKSAQTDKEVSKKELGVPSKKTNMKELIINALTSIEEQMKTPTEDHEKRIKSVQVQLKSVKAKTKDNSLRNYVSQETYGEELALREKWTEAMKQLEEFQGACDKVKEEIRALDPASCTEIDLRKKLTTVEIECSRLRSALPMYARRSDIVKVISNNQVSVILGETGSGKSTQMAQFIYEAGLACGKRIVCTQPRKVAAITLAERVASEMKVKVGNLVGYKVGGKWKLNGTTRIFFSTDHALLNECLVDPDLGAYSCIIIDEAHERSIYTDILLGMIKASLPRRPDLKVVITSATIDPGIFIDYFQCQPELTVSGRTFPVDVLYDKGGDQDFENHQIRAVAKAVKVHQEEGPGDILVFLTSPVETMQCCEEFLRQMKQHPQNFKCFPLHGQLPPEEQKKAFEKQDDGVRKIVFSTNCAETSVTIDGIKFVVDTGLAKEMVFDPKNNLSILRTSIVSKSSANQRKGRAGRTSSGKCYRLYSEPSYEDMAENSLPEILRVHLGHAVLKLAELGVDVESYDFVQAPSDDAMQCAIRSLRELGALDKTQITDMGRFLSKLPFDPLQGYLVYRGIQEELLYETVVLASLISYGSNLFYRGLTETDAQKSARSQSEFASEWGDVFTWLEVFKAWSSVEKGKQSRWCGENNINSKILNLVEKSISETEIILKREFDKNMPHVYSTEKNVTATLRKLLFDSRLRSLCHFLGRAKAGYFAVDAGRQVHPHPSSCLVRQNIQPEWVVYTELTKTSREFIKGLTVVEESWVREAVENNLLEMSLEEASQRRINCVYKDTVGPSVFRELVGPRFTNIRALEDGLTEAGMDTVVVEADRALGTIEVFSSSPMEESFVDKLALLKSKVLETLKGGQQEIQVAQVTDSETGYRVVLGQGGEVLSVLMPGETNQILILKVPKETSVDTVKAKFKAFGKIQECFRFKSYEPWGIIKYATHSEAQAAVQATQYEDEAVAVFSNNKKHEFQASLSWCRRPAKGMGMAFIKCTSSSDLSLLVGVCLDIQGRPCGIKRSNRSDDDLICTNVGSAREEEIVEKIVEHLRYDKSAKKNFRVNINRMDVERPSPREMELNRKELSKEFERHIPQEEFDLQLYPVKHEKVCYQRGIVRFLKPVDALKACQELKDHLYVSHPHHQAVQLVPKLRSSLYVAKAVMEASRKQVEKIIESFEDLEDKVVATIKINNKGDSLIYLECAEYSSLEVARESLQKVIGGKVLEIDGETDFPCLYRQQGQTFLKSLRRKLDVQIILDNRNHSVHIHGADKDIRTAMEHLKSFIKKSCTGKQENVYLLGPGQPPGLLRALLKKFGMLTQQLLDQTGLQDVQMDFKKQMLSLIGDEAAIRKCHGLLDGVKQDLAQATGLGTVLELPSCAACLCPVESLQDMHRLEVCGHAYCLDCLKMQVTVDVQSKQFPLSCAQCHAAMVWRDFNFFLNNKWLLEEKLVRMTLRSCVERPQATYRFCPSVDCPVVYPVTTTPEGCEFLCPVCGVYTCSSCHSQGHQGLPCAVVAGAAQADADFERWRRKDTSNRKMCPACRSPVEKIDGCHKMHCTVCHTYFCWLCLEKAASAEECYDHLTEVHGGCF